mgnify:CR=1 FL=1
MNQEEFNSITSAYDQWAETNYAVNKLMMPILNALNDTSSVLLCRVMQMLMAGKCPIIITKCLMDTAPNGSSVTNKDLLEALNKIQ